MGADAGIFASDVRDARVGRLRRFVVTLRGGVPPSAALGRLEDGAPASRDHLRCWGSAPLCGAPTTIDTGALRPEPPLRATASAAENASSYRPLHELMTFVMCRS